MNERNALLAIHLGALLFGLSGIFGKLAETTPLVITLGRALFAVLALALFARLVGGARAAPRRGARFPCCCSAACCWAGTVLFFQAVKAGGVAIATLGFASFPAFTLLLEGLLFRERIHLREMLVVVLVSVGLVLVTPAFDFASDATQGLIAAILSGLLFSLLSLLNRASTRGLDPVKVALWQNLCIVACVLPLGASLLPTVRAVDWLWIALLGVLCTGLAHSLFVASLKVLNARTTAVIFALEPVYGIAFAWWLFSEEPSLRMLAGGALIIIAIAFPTRRTNAVKPAEATH